MTYSEGTILVCTASSRPEKACDKEWLLYGERTFLCLLFAAIGCSTGPSLLCNVKMFIL